jgi:predicted RNase H-like HicB family nuclease
MVLMVSSNQRFSTNEPHRSRCQTLRYSVVLHTAEEGGFWVEVPALPGCYSQGESVEESLRNVREAIELYLEVLRDEGRDVPKDAEVVYQVSVAV